MVCGFHFLCFVKRDMRTKEWGLISLKLKSLHVTRWERWFWLVPRDFKLCWLSSCCKSLVHFCCLSWLPSMVCGKAACRTTLLSWAATRWMQQHAVLKGEGRIFMCFNQYGNKSPLFTYIRQVPGPRRINGMVTLVYIHVLGGARSPELMQRITYSFLFCCGHCFLSPGVRLRL